jgi:hypothetical protein
MASSIIDLSLRSEGRGSPGDGVNVVVIEMKGPQPHRLAGFVQQPADPSLGRVDRR